MLYDKADRPPKAGSLREALFLHVWLKREEQKVKSFQMMAQGLTDMVAASGGKTTVPDKFKDFLVATFPFMEKDIMDKDTKLKEAVKKMADIEPIQFTPLQKSPLGVAAKRLSAPDEFRKKLADKASSTRKLK